MKRSFTNLIERYSKKSKSSNSARLFFVIACVHAVLQERRTYIPQGWSKWYEFSDTDLTSTFTLVQELLQSQDMQVPWSFIKGLCSLAIYGGRIENIQDLTILDSYLSQYFKDDVLSHRWKPFDLNISLPSTSNTQASFFTL